MIQRVAMQGLSLCGWARGGLLALCLAVLLGFAGSALAQGEAADTGLSVKEASELIIAEQATDTNRRKAADLLVALSQWGRSDATAGLLASLATDRPVEVRRAALSALADATGVLPDDGVVDALLGWMGAPMGELESQWAQVLGRYELPHVAGRLETIARDPDAKAEQRRLAVRALGEHRRPFAAKVLVDLVNDDAIDAAVRGLAFEALGRLSHRPQLGQDRAAWSAWYKDARKMNAASWQRMLHENLKRLNQQAMRKQAMLRERLAQSQRALYRATASAQRPALLVSMLKDPLDNVRALGIDLARESLEDNNTFGDEMRAELRARLTDPVSSIRAQSATLLGQLLDEDGASLMAAVLLNQTESDVKVQRAILNALARMPLAEAFAPAYELMKNPELRPAAAAMLAAGHRAGKGNSAVWSEVRKRVKGMLEGVQTPQPNMVTLLALVIAQDDTDGWSRIRGWLESEDDLVREAAARSWAQSGRSLLVLAQRSDDAVIRPIALQAVAARGSDGRVLSALATRRPVEPDDVRMWDQALVALAGRVPPDAVLAATQQLSKAKADTRQTREAMLTAAVDRIAASDPPPAPTASGLALLLARAQTRVLSDSPKLVVLDYEAALDQVKLLTDAQADAARRGLARAYIADRRLKDALDIATLLLKPEGTLIAKAIDDPIVAMLIQSVNAAIEQGRKDDAGKLLLGLRTLLDSAISAELDAELIKLKERIDADPPAPPPADRADPPAAS